MSFYIRDLSACGYGYVWGVLKPIPMDAEGQLPFAMLPQASVFSSFKWV